MYAYNTQVYRTTNIAPFELVFSKAPKSIALKAQASLEELETSRKYYLKWQSWLESLIEQTSKSFRKEQARYQRNFDARLRRPRYEIYSYSFACLRKKQGIVGEPKNKLAKMATGPY